MPFLAIQHENIWWLRCNCITVSQLRDWTKNMHHYQSWFHNCDYSSSADNWHCYQSSSFGLEYRKLHDAPVHEIKWNKNVCRIVCIVCVGTIDCERLVGIQKSLNGGNFHNIETWRRVAAHTLKCCGSDTRRNCGPKWGWHYVIEERQYMPSYDTLNVSFVWWAKGLLYHWKELDELTSSTLLKHESLRRLFDDRFSLSLLVQFFVRFSYHEVRYDPKLTCWHIPTLHRD